jgi:predicted RNase H-like nuclease (RuvC/YqgF family)
MKNLYFIILTLFTITSSNATDFRSPGDSPTDDGRSTAGFSDACSTRSVELRSLLQPVEYEIPEGVEQYDREKILTEFVKVAEAYTNLLEYVNAKNAQIEDFSRMASQLLPDASKQNSLFIDKLLEIRQKFTKIAVMLKDAKKTKKLTADQNKALQSSVEILTARVAELEETATQAARLERTYKDQMDAFTTLEEKLEEREAKIGDLEQILRRSNERARQDLETIGNLEEQLKRLGHDNIEQERASSMLLVGNLTAERDTAMANFAAEKARADAAVARARKAEHDAAAANAVNGDERAPLNGRGNGSRRPPKEEKHTCPCVVM